MASVTDSKWFQLVVSIIAIAAGVFAAGYAAREIMLYRAAVRRVQPVAARILSHGLDERTTQRTGASSGWMPVIVYEYTVDGQDYQSDTVLPRPTYQSKAWANEILATFPIGTTQTAYYNPARPNESYLQTTSFHAVNYVVLSIGLLFLSLGSAKSIEILWKTFRT